MRELLIFLVALFLGIEINAQSGVDLRSFEAQIDSIIADGPLPGAQIALVHRDSVIWIGNFGMAHKENEIPVSDETYFRIGSITKSFVSLAALMLVEEGRMDLNQSLREAAPDVEFQNPWEATHPVRLVHLLEHTTGFDDWHLSEYALNGESLTLKEGIDHNSQSRVSRWPPGRHVQYCNSGPPLVAYVIERITGLSFEEFVAQRIFVPLVMPNTTFRQTPFIKQHLASGYSGTGVETEYWHVGMRPAGSINSNAVEMSNLVRLFLNHGAVDSVQLVQSGSIDRMEVPATTYAARAGITEGYGLSNYTHTYKGFTFHGHSGGMDGYVAQYGYDRDLGVGYVILVNGADFGTTLKLVRKTLDVLLDEKTPTRNNAAILKSIPENLPGIYRVANSRVQLVQSIQWLLGIVTLKVEEDTLIIKPLLQGPSKLVPLSTTSFRIQGLGGFSSPVVFIDSEEEGMIIQVTSFPFWNNLIRSSWFSAYMPIALAGLALTLIFSVSLFTLGWLAMWVAQKSSRTHLWLKLAPILCLLPLIVLPFMLQGLDTLSAIIFQLGSLTFQSFMVFLLPLLFTLLSVGTLAASIRSLVVEGPRVLLTYYVVSVSAAFCLVAGYFIFWGVIGLRLWAY